MDSADLFLKACRRERVERTPIWIMRQAGRYLPEYRALREKVDFLTSCRTPEVACEITLQPVRRLGVDAAILFSDIMIPLPGMGVPVAFDPGPKIAAPIRSRSDIEALRVPDARETTPFVMDAIKLVRKELNGSVPLIGFAGAPFTMASYMVEGGGSKSFAVIKKLLFAEPELAHLLLTKCADTIVSYLREQIRAGAQAVMLFDTWGGVLAPEDYREFALAYARRVFDALSGITQRVPQGGTPGRGAGAGADAASVGAWEGEGGAPSGTSVATGSAEQRALPSLAGDQGSTGTGGSFVPTIYYAGEASCYAELLTASGADVIGLDWRISLRDARRRIGNGVALQGNLDPALLLGPPERLVERARRVLIEARDADDGAAGPSIGHIFNLGHGILPETSPDHARILVDEVHRLSAGEGP